VFWLLQSNSKVVGVPEDSKFPLLGMWVSSSHLPQSGVATLTMLKSRSSWNLVPLPTSNTKGGVREACWKLRDYTRKKDKLFSYSVMHQNQPTSWLVHIRNHFWCWDKPRATRIHLTHHGPDSGEATTFPHIVFFVLLRGTRIQMTFSPGTPKEESRICPGLDSRDFGSS